MKLNTVLPASLMVLLIATAAVAQHEHHGAQAAATATSALTAEAVQQLLSGEGMGLARPAEMNTYPGPKHVLELKTALNLTSEQEKTVEQIRQQMLDAARRLGRSIVDAERALDAAFKAGPISKAEVVERTSTIARLQGELRAVHLHAHLLTKPVLTDEQIKKYYAIRTHH